MTVLGQIALVEKDPYKAIILALQAQKLTDGIEARDLLEDATSSIDILGEELHGNSDDVTSVAWSADGRLASGSMDNTVIIWDLTNNQPIQILRGHTDDAASVAWSADGRLASGSTDNTIIIWDLTNNQPAQILRGHTDGVTSVAWSADGRLASGSADNTVIIWDLTNNQPVQILRGHTNGVASVAWSPSVVLASSSIGAEVIIWDIASGQPLKTISGQGFDVTSVAWSADGRLAFGTMDWRFGSIFGTVIIWDLVNSQPVQTLRGRGYLIYSLAWSADGRLASTMLDGPPVPEGWVDSNSLDFDSIVMVWNFGTGIPTHILRGHSDSVLSVAWSPNGQLASGAKVDLLGPSRDDTVIIWKLDTSEPIPTMLGQTEGVLSVAWSVDGRLASGTWDGKIIIWDLASGTPAQTLSVDRHNDPVSSIAWSKDGRLASGSFDGIITIWDVASGRPIQTLYDEHRGIVHSLAWSPNGQLASGYGCESSLIFTPQGKIPSDVIVWDVPGGQPAQILHGHTDIVRSVSWSAEGRLVSGSWDGKVILWDLANGRPAQILHGHTDGIASVAWSADGRLASGSSDGMVIVWDLLIGRPDRIFRRYSSNVTSLAWSSDGRLASGSADGTVTVFASNLTNPPCDLALRNLTVEEWVKTVGVLHVYHPACPNISMEDIPFPSLDDWQAAAQNPAALLDRSELGNYNFIGDLEYFLPTRFLWLTWPGRLMALGCGLLILGLAGLVIWLPFTDSSLVRAIVLGYSISLGWMGYKLLASYEVMGIGLAVLSVGLIGSFLRLLFKRAKLVKIAFAFGLALSTIFVLVDQFVIPSDTGELLTQIGIKMFSFFLIGLALQLLFQGVQWIMRRAKLTSR